MNPELVERLNAINREFYNQFADAFAGSRTLAQPSLRRLLSYVPARARVLDVGCGNGRLGHLLAEERPGGHYVGLDASSALIHLAEVGMRDVTGIVAGFAVVDVLESGWSQILAGECFSTIFALAMLHHLPGYRNRRALLEQLKSLVAPSGYLILSTWQFTTNERMRRKIVSWDNVGLEPAGLEPGDFLLDWRRDGVGYRYCHLVDDQELRRLAEESNLELLETFRADGKEGDLSLFGILQARSGA